MIGGRAPAVPLFLLSLEGEAGRAAHSPLDRCRTLVDLLRWRSEEHPERSVYTFLANGTVEAANLTYGELDRLARAVAAELLRSAQPGDRAVLLYPPGLEFIVSLFGCFYAGVVAVPAYPPQPHKSNRKLRSIVEEARPSLVLTTAALLSRIEPLTLEIPRLAASRRVATDVVPDELAGEWQAPALGPDSLAFLQYTSGSTSDPKGVMVSHANFLANERMIRDACGHSEKTVFVGWLPLYHDMGLMGNVIQPLSVGGRSILMAPAAFLSSPVRWLAAISHYRATTSGGPNFAYDLCVRRITPEQRAGLDLSSWTVAFNGAEPIRAATIERFAAAFAGCGFSRRAFFPCYGLAEATLYVSGSGLGAGPVTLAVDGAALSRHAVVPCLSGAEGSRELVSSGRPETGLTAVVVDPDSNAPCAAGRVGEIWISGPSIAQGYWGRPETTTETFGARLPGDALNDGEAGPFLRTGDLGFLNDGEIYVTGRLKDLIILRGRNHYPQDLELTAELAHPALQAGSTAAFAVQVDGEERLAVVVELRPRSRNEPDSGIESVAPAVRRAVAEEHEVQVYAVALVPPGTVLKTSSGKVRRGACRDLFLNGELETLGVSLAGDEEVAAWTGSVPCGEDLLALEEGERRRVAAAYLRQEAGRILRLDPARIETGQPLAALGLDSLSAIEMEQRISEGLGVELAMPGLLEGASLDELTERVLGSLGARKAVPLPVLSEVAEAPLSAMQKALWFEQQMAPESAAFNISFAARLDSGVDVPALRRSLAALVGRHAALRSTVTVRDGQPVQRFARETDLVLVEREVSGGRGLVAEVAGEANRPFDLMSGPLFRAALFTSETTAERVLLLVAHHLIFDGWSLWLLLDELRLLYAAAVEGREPGLPALRAGYADFVRWQEAVLAGAEGEKLWQYWRGEMAGGMPILQLPDDRPRSAGDDRRTGAVHRFAVAPELAERLRGLARAEGTTLYAVLLAAYQALLARTAGQPEVVVGAAVSGRSRPELRDVVGCLFNTVPLRTDVGDDPTFRELLRRVRGKLTAALQHQDYPSHLLAERLEPGRAAGGSPFFQTLFLYQKPQRFAAPPRLLPDGSVRLDLGSLLLDVLFVEPQAARAGLELEVFAAGDAITAWFRYSTRLFEAATVERLARHLTALLDEAAADADRPVSDLEILAAAERDLLLREWSSTGRDDSSPALIHELFAEQAARTPGKTAAVCGEESVTYRELHDRASRLADLLRTMGRENRRGNRRGLVGLMAEPAPPLLTGMLGILASGNGFVPLDPDSPAERLERMIADCGLTVLATDERHAARAAEIARVCPAVEHRVHLDGNDLPAGIQAQTRQDPGEGIAYVIFTSGSTGVPKGVPITHANLVPLLLWSREVFGFGEHTRALQSLSYVFDFGVFEILTTLLFGGTLYLRGGAERGDVDGYLRDARRHAINTIHTTPSFFRAVTVAAKAAGERLDALEVLHLGGEALGEGLAAESLSVAGPECRLFNGYGPTEASVNCALYEVERAGRRPAGRSSIPIGYPSASNRLYVLDGRRRPAPLGAPGELYVGGIGLSRGYLGRPALTAERFVPDPFAGTSLPGERLYRTGDLVRFHNDGAIEFLGRLDNQVKVRGYRIELEEIEAALALHPEVAACAVTAWRPEAGEVRLVAYVAARTETSPDTVELRRFLGRTLAPYMVPATFVFLPELPVNISGKIDRKALPPPAEAQPASPYAAPRTPLEEALAGIWSRCLGIERVGIGDDFFELGGHSLLGTRILSLIRKELGVEVPLRTFFESPTIARLAAAVEQASRVDLPPIQPAPRDGELPLSFAQERIWFLTQLAPNLRSYLVPRALEVRGSFDPALVAVAFSEIVRRHEILRTTFHAVEGRPVQVIHPPFPMALPVVDLGALPAAARQEELRQRMLEEGRRLFDLVRGPLLRLTLLRLAPEEHVLVITEHHLVHDGWTQGVLLREFLALYAAFCRSEPSPLPELPVQYADFAVWQRLWLRDDVLERQLAYWKERLTGAPAVLALPADRPRSAIQSFRGDQVRRVLPAPLSRALRGASRRLGATLFMFMLSAWDTLMMRLSGQEDLCIGTGVANRRVVEAEGLLGMVINTLVLRADLSGAPTFARLLARMREVCVGAYGHQDLPFEKLVTALGLPRNLSHTPLFQVFFAFLDTPSPELELPGLSISVLDAHNRSAKFDINITVLLPSEQRIGLETGAREDEITLLFEYSTDLFERTTVLRMLEQFQLLLEAAVMEPELRLQQMPLLTAAAAHQLCSEHNDTAAPYAADLCLHDLVFAQARHTPRAPAVRCGEERLTYDELAGRARRLAEHLGALGIAPGSLVGLAVDRSAEMVVALLGVLEAGAAYVPLDPTFPRERLALMIEDAQPSLLLTQERVAGALPQGVPTFFLERTGEEPARSRRSARSTPGDLAYVLYTSGSTGRPKGVAIPHRAVVNFLAAVRRSPGLATDDVLLALTTLSFDIAVLEIFLPLTVGASVVVATREEARGGAELCAALADPAITVLQATPATWRLLLESGWEGSPRLKALCGGEALPPDLADRLVERCGELWNLYGPTETTVWSLTRRVISGRRGSGGSVPVGRPLGNTEVHLLDRDSNPVPIGVPGELWIGGAGLSLGYLGRADLTAAAFRPDPFAAEPGARLYHTGDLARRLPDGVVEFLGRIDHQVKVRGFRIELGEIEAHLGRHPGVQAAAAAVYEAAPGDRRIAAYLVGGPVAADELRRLLAESLPEYMLPAAWVWLETLPLTPNGKVDRKALPRPDSDRMELAVAFVAPRTEIERTLAAAWCEVLGTEEVGVHDNFFDLGGHSLLGTRLMARIESRLGVTLPLRTLFEAPTVAGLAGKVGEALGRASGLPPAPPLAAGPRPEVLPLSFAQERLWLLDQIERGSAAYNIPCAVHLAGTLDPAALERAISAVVCRHEALRTRFEASAGEPRQVIEPPLLIHLPVVDLTSASEAEVLRVVAAEAVHRFDLARTPLLRACLLWRRAAGREDHILVLTLHHIAADGWSLGILVREIAAFYQGEALAELPLQYADFALWQRGWLAGETLEKEVDWWRQRLLGAPEEISLPTDRPRTAAPAVKGGLCRISLPLAAELSALGRERQATLFMVLLAVFSTLLSRWSGEEDLVVGSPVANRNRVETEGLIGIFVNMLPLRVDLAGQPTFADLLARVHEGTLAAYAHQDLPFEKLVEALRPARHLGRTPLFQVSCVLQNAPWTAVEIPGLSWSPLPVETGTAKFDLSLSLSTQAGDLAAALEYRTALFDAATAGRLLKHWQNLLEGCVADPEARISDLPLLSSAERRQAVIGWNETRARYPREATIQELFEAQVEATPEAAAVVGDGRTWSYRELNRLANRLAHHLRSLGVGPEILVGLCLDRSPDLVAAILGILKAGGAYVPLDPSYPQERLRLLLDDTGLRLVISRGTFAELALGSIPAVDLDRDADTLVRQSGENPPPAGSADHLAYVMYTSGSTGVPKGVAVTHRGVVRLVHAADYVCLGPAEVFLQLAPASFDASTFEIWGALLKGGRLAIFPHSAPSLEELAGALAYHGVTTLWLAAGLFHQLVDERLGALAGVRQLLAGGDVLSPAHVQRVFEELPGCTLINGYGPTENTTFTCCRPLTGGWKTGGSVPIGRPIANTRVYLLDRALQPVPVGVPGELYAGGDGLARGYLRRPALTAERFVPDPFGVEVGEPGSRLYRTGDLARRQMDGDIEFLGRTDQQVKVRGFRVELGEIETHLGRHPAVRAAAAAVYEAAPGDRRVAAYLVAASQPVPTVDELRRFLADSLPQYMLPAAWVWLETLPLNQNGKVDRRALPRPETGRPELAVAFATPRTELERALAGAWSEILGAAEIGIHDNFFDLGGHSLLGMQLVARIESRLGVVLPLRALFEAPTVALLAGRIESTSGLAGHRPAPPLRADPRPAEPPLSFAQERLWLLEQIEGVSAAYNIPCAVHLAGVLDMAALGSALNQVVCRHEALRTRFEAPSGEPRQVIEPPRPLSLPVIDLTGAPEAEALARAAAEAVRPFDLGRSPLLRACLLRRAAADHLLILTVHHIAADGWSLGVLVRELAAFYQGQTLTELPIQYADFALWQRRWLSGETLEQEIAWWRERLAGAPEEIALPADRPRAAAVTDRGGRRLATVPLPENLGAFCRERQVTLFMVLLAAYSTLLSRWGGEEDLVVGSPVANRNRVEIEGLIGFFVNMLPLRIDLAGHPSFTGLLERVREATLAAYGHQDVPFEKLVEALRPQRHLGRAPLFQVSLALQNAPFEALAVPGLRWSPLPLETRTAKFDLSLSLTERSGGLDAGLSYRTDLFDTATAERLLGCFERLLAAAVAAPDRPLGELPLLSASEWHALVCEANDTARSLEESRSVHRLFEMRAAADPDVPALVAGQERLTFQELNRWANVIAHRLQRYGVSLESRVGLAVDRSAAAVAGLLGILKAGGAYVPIDPTHPAERLRWLLADSGADFFLVPEKLAPRFAELEAGRLVPFGCEDRLAGESAGPWVDAAPEVGPDNAAYVLYTSGSTGQPKGVVVRHGAVVNLAHALLTGVYAGDPRPLRVGLNASLAFDGSVKQLVQLLWGHTVCLIPEEARLDPKVLVDLVRSERLDVLDCTPSQLHMLLAAGLAADPQAGPRLVLVGGEPIDPGTWESALARPWTRFVNVYGPTECTVDTTACPFPAMATPSALGRPLANVRVHVVDGAGGPQPVGVAGELWIGGAGLARGYHGRPDLTAERFVPDPFGGAPGERLYRSGDRARRLPDGSLDFLGRTDDQVKVRGFRIEIGEIEAHLSRHPALRAAAAGVYEGAPGDRRIAVYLVAGLVAGSPPAPSVEELRLFLAGSLPDYMLPAAWVWLDALPLNSNGKVDRKALPRPESDRPELATAFIAPRTELERTLAAAWCEVLGTDAVGVHDNFFDLGGHSLLAVQVISRVRDTFEIELPFKRLFDSPTVAELAVAVVEQLAEQLADGVFSEVLGEVENGGTPALVGQQAQE